MKPGLLWPMKYPTSFWGTVTEFGCGVGLKIHGPVEFWNWKGSLIPVISLHCSAWIRGLAEAQRGDMTSPRAHSKFRGKVGGAHVSESL